MNLYRQSIILFGIVVPVILAVLIIVGAVTIKSKVAGSFETKIANYKKYEMDEKGARNIEAEIARRREDSQRWDALVSEETASSISSHLREIEEKLPSKEFQTTVREFPTNKGGFAAVSGQGSSQVRLAFRATFRSMQLALLDLETRMPQLQLQDLSISPSNNSNSLNFNVTYTAWEK